MTEIIEPIKKYLFKNKFVLTFNIFALFSFIFLLSSFLSFSLKISFLVKLTGLFSSTLWLFLVIAFVISGILAYYEKYKLMFIPILIWLLLTTAVVRTSNIEGLKNEATGDWTLGPDLDPYLFLRNAIEINEGKNLGTLDMMRYAPLGAGSTAHSSLMPRAILSVYGIVGIFSSNISITYAAIIAPVIFFILSLIGFFLFVYLLFSFKLSKVNSLAGATIASFFYTFIPDLLHRTVAGVPELESLGMVWFWPALICFILAWKQGIEHNKIKTITYGLLAGIFTGLMSWTWGGYKYIYMIFALASFLAFLFNIQKRKNLIIFASFLATGLIIELIKVKSLSSIISSFTDTGFALAVFAIMAINFILFETRIKDISLIKKISEKTKLPENVISIILFVLLILIIKPSLVLGLVPRIIGGLLHPYGTGRIGLTVAENRAPYFVEVLGNFGSLIWLFLLGIVVIFYEATKHFDKRKKLILNSFFVLFIASFIFSRISSQNVLNGENSISKILYFGGLFVFLIVLLTVYIRSWLRKDEKTLEDFSKIHFDLILLLSFSFWAIVSMRGAIRLFFIIAPLIIIIVSYFLIKIWEYRKTKSDVGKLVVWAVIILSLFITASVFINYAGATVVSAKYSVPSGYNQQWNYAMNWVEQNTSENSTFVHWWDYGYWVQTIGQRPTVTDGGHANNWWDHTTARYLLTTSRPETALSLMKTHNVSYLLIDSTDVGKYSAFSGIGSDETGKDRLSWIPVMPIDPQQITETKNTTLILFAGGSAIDEDIIYKGDNETQVFLPGEKAGLAGVIVEYTKKDNKTSFLQPKGIFVYNNKRYDLPLKHVYYNGLITDFGSGVDATIDLIPGISQTNNGMSINPFGAAIYLSPKTQGTLFAQLYLLDDVNKRYPTITLAHAEDDFIIKTLLEQGINLGHFIYFQGLRGPIKIWEVDYPENIQEREEFLWNIDPEGNWAKLDNLTFIS